MDWQALLGDEGGLHSYLARMAHNAEWGDGIMIEAASAFYQRPVIIVPSAAHAREESTQHTIRMGVQSDKTPITLGYCSAGEQFNSSAPRNHYVSLRPVACDELRNEEKGTTGEAVL